MADTLMIELAPTYQPSGAGIYLSNTKRIKVELHPILRGEKGDPGSSTSRYAHTQSSAASVWTVPHNLNARPSVTVTDHLGNQVIADVTYIDGNIVQVTHANAITGFVFCN